MNRFLPSLIFALFHLLLLLCLSSKLALAVPTGDELKMADRLKSLQEMAQSFNDLKNEYINKYMAQIQGSSGSVDVINNSFSNEIVRNNQARLDGENQRLRISSQAVDVCGNYSLSNALNDLACDSLSALAENGSNYIQKSQNHEWVAKDAATHNVSDINTMTLSTLPIIDHSNDVEKQAEQLQEQAYKGTANTLTQSIKIDQANLYNPLTNKAADDFGTDEIKKIQENYSKSQLYRKMAVMLAQKNYADMLAYKHQLQSELAMTMQLLQQVGIQYP
ncbi:MAG: hypothetical protein O2809_07720 [Proteobacteria bacterium]|nr:hypothetical protein [Pseudomonadota bacterium]